MAGLFSDLNSLNPSQRNQYSSSVNAVTKGSLISFDYPSSFANHPNVIHDPKPMLIVTDVWAPNYVRGLNLHYLTYPYIKNILQNWAGNQGFSYFNIKADRYVASAFRMYNMRGIMRPKRLDSDWLKTVLQTARTFDAGELEKIRATIQQQIQSRLQVKANELSSYEEYKTNFQNNLNNNQI